MMARLYYGLFLVLGVVVSFEDWSHKRISNRWILFGMLAGAAGCSYLLWNSILGHQHMRGWRFGEYYYPWRYYPKMLTHLFLSFTAAFTLWRLSVWPAGDAKLYTLFAFLLVIIDPNLPGFPLLLFMLMLVNIFVPAALLFAAQSAGTALRRLPEALKIDWRPWFRGRVNAISIRLKEAWPYRYNYLMITANTFALFYAMQMAQSSIRKLPLGPFGQIVVFLLMFVAWGRLSGFLRSKMIGLVALLSLSTGTVAGAFWRHWDIWARIVCALKMTASFGMFLSFARGIFYWFIEKESLRELVPEQLEAGVVLSDETWRELGVEKDLAGKLGARYSDGLSQEDVNILQEWLAKPRAAPPAGGTVRGRMIYQTIPFAVWIFLGSLFTLVERQNLVALLASHFAGVQGILKAWVAWWLS